MTSGYPSDATESAVQANINAAGYAAGGSGGSSTGALHADGASKCLDDPYGTTTGGTQQQIWGCNGQANQTWTHTSSNQLTVTNNGTTDCLDASGQGTSAGTKVIIWPCTRTAVSPRHPASTPALPWPTRQSYGHGRLARRSPPRPRPGPVPRRG